MGRNLFEFMVQEGRDSKGTASFPGHNHLFHLCISVPRAVHLHQQCLVRFALCTVLMCSIELGYLHAISHDIPE